MKNIFYGWWIVITCFVLSLYVGSVNFFGFTAFFKPLVKEFGWSYTQISFAASLRGLEMGIFAPIIGFLVDRVGSRKVILCGTITIGLGLILLSLTRSLAMFYGSFFLLALGAGGCTSVVLMAVVANWFHKNVGKAMGLMASGFGAGGLIVPLIVYLIDVYQWRTALVILGLGMWTIGIPLSFVIRHRPEPYGLLPDGAIANDKATHREIRYEEVEIDFKEAVKHRSFIYLNIAEAIRLVSGTAVVIHVMPYLSSVGIARSTAGLVAAAIPLFSIIGRFGFGWLGDIFDKRYVMVLAFLMFGTGTLAFRYVETGWPIFLFLLLFPPGFGGTMVLRGAILREYFGRGSFGRLIGIVMGSASIGGIIGPTFAGWVFDTTGNYHLAWLLLSGIMGLAIWSVFRIKALKK